MKKLLATGKSGVMWRGKIITDPKDVPTDAEIESADKAVIDQRKALLAARR